MYYVYLYRDLNDLPMYVGKGKGTRAFDHLKPHIRLKGTGSFYAALNEMINNDERPFIEIVRDGLTSDEAFALEKLLVAMLGRRVKNTGPLYNEANGGNGGAGDRSAETRAKISKSLKGVKKPDGFSQKLSNRLITEDHKANLRKSTSGAGNGQAKLWLLQKPDGSSVEVPSLYTFCKQNNLAYSALVQTEDRQSPVVAGKSKGWKVLKRMTSTRTERLNYK